VSRSLRNQVVLITGCSSGIGRALAEEFVGSGHRVVATARRQETIEDLAGPAVLIHQLDVTDSGSAAEAVAAAVEWGEGLDMVVNNAGFGLIGPAAELDLAEFRGQLETNLIGALRMVQAVVPHMVEQGSGRIVNIGSVSGLAPTPFGGAYSASKAALHALGDSLRIELAPFGVEVLTVQPGAVATCFAETSLRGLDRYRKDASLYREFGEAIEARARLSQNRPTSAEDFARGVVPKLLAVKAAPIIRFGRGSRLMPVIARLPARSRDRLWTRRFGLTRS
jgi:NAD(P)-dependent dehydrogenase (short-subunit alcohol dehydrogenase family)